VKKPKKRLIIDTQPLKEAGNSKKELDGRELAEAAVKSKRQFLAEPKNKQHIRIYEVE